MQLFVLAQKLHALELMGQEMGAQVEAHVALLEGVALPASTPLEDEATLGQCAEEALSTLEAAGRTVEVKSMVPGPVLGKPCWASKKADSQRGRTRQKEDGLSQAVDAVRPALCQCCAHLWQDGSPRQLLSPL